MQHHHRFHRIEQSVTFFEVGGMKLKPKRPTLAKTALGWGTLKFRYVRTQHGPPLGRFCNIRKDLLNV
jgi:hypothetical protein